MTPPLVTPFVNRVTHRCGTQTDTASVLQAEQTGSHISLAHLLYTDGEGRSVSQRFASRQMAGYGSVNLPENKGRLLLSAHLWFLF